MSEVYKQFAQLCESIVLNESSEIVNILKFHNFDKAAMLGREIHKTFGIPHDSHPGPVPAVQFPKVSRYASYAVDRPYFIIIGKKKVEGQKSKKPQYKITAAAIYKAARKNLPYEILGLEIPEADNTDQNIKLANSRADTSSTAMSEIKRLVGQVVAVYKGVRGSSVKDLQQHRQKRQKNITPGLTRDNYSQVLLKKFSPLFLRMLKSVEAEYRGMLNVQIKNRAYAHAEEKIAKLKEIEKAIDTLEDFAITPGYSSKILINKMFATALEKAVLATANTFYPEEYTDDNLRIQRLLNDISQGDVQKMSTLLKFFKAMYLRFPRAI